MASDRDQRGCRNGLAVQLGVMAAQWGQTEISDYRPKYS